MQLTSARPDLDPVRRFLPPEDPTPLARRLQNAAFEALWQGAFVYNILFEDSEVDEALFDLDQRSRVLAVSGAGCGVAGMLSAHPRRIDAVDLNLHHLALTALKCAAARGERSFERFQQLFREGRVRSSLAAVGSLSHLMPAWAQRYWGEHHARFERGLYQTGLTASMLGGFRAFAGLDATWLRAAMPMDRLARIRHLESRLLPLLRTPIARAWLSSPAQLLALGINFSQRDRLLQSRGAPDMATLITRHLTDLVDTDLRTNWFVWYAVAGHFDPDVADCAPPYLRHERHERALGTPTDLRLHRRSILDYLRTRSAGSFTHYALLDVPDWLSPEGRSALFSEITRTAEDGALVLLRTVESGCPVEELGLSHRFVLDAQKTRVATELDRTRQYRSVRFYRVAA